MIQAFVAQRKASRHFARRFIGGHVLAQWLPEHEYARQVPKRGGELPELKLIAETAAQIIDQNFNSEIEREFRDAEGLDGQKAKFDDGESAEMGSYYVAFGLYEDDRPLWGNMENLRECWLWPVARALIRAAERTPRGKVVVFMRPPMQYQPVHSLSSFTAVFNAVCVRATEFIEDGTQSLLLDALMGVKGHLARIPEV